MLFRKIVKVRMRLLSKFIASVLVLCSAQVAFAESSQMVSDEFIADLGLTQDEFQRELDEADAALAADGPYTQEEISEMLSPSPSPSAAPEEDSTDADSSSISGANFLGGSYEEAATSPDGSTGLWVDGLFLDVPMTGVPVVTTTAPPPSTEPTVVAEPANVTSEPTSVPSFVATDQPTTSPTDIPTVPATATHTDAPTGVPTEVPTAIATGQPTDAPTGEPTVEPTVSGTETPEESETETPEESETETPEESATATPTDTDTPILTATATATSTATETATSSETATQTTTPASTETATPTPTATATATPTPPMCCICLESAVQDKEGKKWRASKCKKADWGSLCGESDTKVNCYTYKGKEKERANCNPSLSGLQCRAKSYLFMASDDKKHEKKCLIEDCYSKGSDVPTDTSVVGQCSPNDKDDKKMLCDMAKSVATVLARQKASVSYSWMVPKNDVTNGGTQCPAPGSDAFRETAGTIYKIVASKDGVVVSSQTFPSTAWVKEPSFCGPTNAVSKTITMHIFTQPKCPPCETSKATLASEKRRLRESGITLNVVEHNIATQAGLRFAKEHGISVPRTPVFAVPNGNRGLSEVSDAIAAIKDAERRISK
jgi:glutaredoxin